MKINFLFTCRYLETQLIFGATVGACSRRGYTTELSCINVVIYVGLFQFSVRQYVDAISPDTAWAMGSSHAGYLAYYPMYILHIYMLYIYMLYIYRY